MKLIGNVIWFLIYGLWMAAVHFVIGVAFCATVIFIPTGLQFIKIARYAIWPFGHSAVTDFDRHPICNLLWIPLFGWWLSLIHLLVGIVLCITLLDKHGVAEMRKLIKELKNEGKTILLASHNQGDIDELCDTVCEMDAGIMTMIREDR